MKILKCLLVAVLLFTFTTANQETKVAASDSVTIGSATTLTGAVKEAMKGVESGWTKLEKVLYLHDYLVTHTSYDMVNYKNGTIPSVDYTAKGALVNKMAVCEGYAEAFKLLMEEIGVPCNIVRSYSMDHAWNIIKLDGYWYHVDCTWDEMSDIDGTSHLNFLRSDEGIKDAGHYGWSSSYKCSSTKYDNFYWEDVDFPFYESDGYWYYSIDHVVYKTKNLANKGTRVIGFNYIFSFAMDDDYIYFTYIDTVKRMNKDGSNIVTLLTCDKDKSNMGGVRFVNGEHYYSYYDKTMKKNIIKLLDTKKTLPEVKVNILKEDINIMVGESECLTLGDYYNFDKNYNLCSYITVADPSIAKFDGDFIEGVKKGKTTATLHAENNKTFTFDVIVSNSKLSFDIYTPKMVFVGKNERISYDVMSKDNQYSWEDVKFTSSDPSIAIYDEHYLQSFKTGECTITASLPDGTSDTHKFVVVDELGWHELNGDKYYFNEYKERAELLNNIDGDLYYFNYDGVAFDDGWFIDMYYLMYDLYAYEDGKLAVGWNGIDGKIYYFNEETGYLEKEVKDVVSGKWYYDTVVETYERGLMTGTTDTTFEPNSPMTRGMVVTVLHRIAGKPQVSFTGRFSDVWSKKYCAMAVEWAAKYKVVSGYKDGTFGADDNITRQDVAVILHNYAKTIGLDLTKTKDLSTFKDYKNVSSYSKSALEWACANGILSGTKDGKLNPKGNATRAECAKMLLQFSKLVESK